MMKLTNCTRCPLHKNRTQVVRGKGNKNASVMFVGEAPGKNEDEKGEPFIGKAGQNLDKYFLEPLGLVRDEVWITNAVKCRPKNNATPKPVEAKRCFIWLTKEIKTIKPELIIALGNSATASLTMNTYGDEKKHITTGDSYITFNKTKGLYVFNMLHPAALLYNSDRFDKLDNKILALKSMEFKCLKD